MKPLFVDPAHVALLVRIAEGDRSALKALYNQAAPHLYAILSRSIDDPSDAEDILVDIFTAVWNRPHDCYASPPEISSPAREPARSL